MFYVIFDSYARPHRVWCGPVQWYRHWYVRRMFRKAAL